MDRYAALKTAVETAELVDAHAHSIVALDSTFPFLSCFSEATGDALTAVPHTINFKRSLKEIAELYGSNSSLDVVQEYRSSCGVESVTSKCLRAARISAVLIDDGLELDKMHNIEWHKKFFPFVGRILRIERVAEKILDELISLSIITHADKIVGFKSIAAYRSGLEINTNISEKDAEEGLNNVLQAGKPVRITNKNFIDHIFICASEVAQCLDLPLQIHTGFGDKDLDLRLSNPLHLRSLLEDNRFSKCKIVLMHASYPFSKEASFLASVYPQVYLDFGLAVPKLSFHGMLSSVKELLELAPINKVMFSTDACGFPESFYLGAKKAREVMFAVLRDACINEDLSIPESIEAVKDIFSENARKLYKIKAVPESFDSNDIALSVKLDINTSAQAVAFVRIIWVDGSGQHRCRVVPQKRFYDVVSKNGVGLTCASMAMSSHMDGPADGTNLSGVGEIRLIPDLSTKSVIPWANEQEMVLGDMHLKPGTPWEYCPRETLRRVSKILKEDFNMVMNAGFENEFFLLRNAQENGMEKWVPFDATSYCSTAATNDAFPVLSEIAGCLQSLNIAVEQLHAEAGHGQFEFAFGYTNCESAADNIVFAREVIRAVARKHGLLATFVPKFSLDDIGSGSHVHISLSENGENIFMGRSGETKYGISKIGEEFMAGVLDHLPSILAFTAPVPNSYDRIQPNTWSGAYLCWGMENREAPLRAASPPGTPDGSVSNFEIKVFDGCANPHLGLASIMAAGIDGLRRHLTLPEPIDDNPDNVKDKVRRLPKSLSESVEALEKDTVLRDLIGEKLLVAIEGVRKAEIKYYSENKDAWKNLIYKY
ncbi:nodulin/glutamine synthase-like protein [Perilla frutescens var. hirtella]|uniref:Nodulin/glutamine synthase-like protein n=1 Tax=Perilla frutescens var. hirtella TaxID=608512 RepID=A0AAD4NWQ1_PERFH|nr:nodulin/glutamine synthase-like protein [Perilla frutescens var. hirtella]KAH6797655.1 nodulin/glutamine synthase-like protein [Perilla frutescens var. hirtella]KAH6807397.1 nodulin/glutamine synthase-like protein [Perilla frutescens var. frutescens]